MKEKNLYKGMIFDLVEKEVEIHGKPYRREIIRHPGGVGVLCVKDERVLLVRQYRHAIEKETLEIPAGKLEYGDDPMTCGMRELNEEARLEADSLELIETIVSTPGFCDERIYIYKACNPRKAVHELAQDEDEDLDSFWLPLDEAYEKVRNREIEDAKTVVAIQYAVIEKERERGN